MAETVIIKHEIKTIDDIDKLKDTWKALEKGKDMTIFQGNIWHRLLTKEWLGWKLHSIYSKVVIYIAFQNEKPSMIFPAIIYKINTKNRWFGNHIGVYLMGQGSYSDYMNVIYDTFSSTVFEAIIDEIRKDYPGKKISLTSVRPDTALASYLKEKGTHCENGELALYINRKESMEAYQKSLTSKHRNNLNRALRRMEKDGITYTSEIIGMISDPALLEKLVQIHVKRLTIKNTNNSNPLSAVGSFIKRTYRRHRDLHNNIVAMSMCENPASNIMLFRFNGEIIGYQYAMKDRNTMRLLQTAFDDNTRHYSPGFRGIFDYIIKSYETDEIQQIDFLRGSEPYKYELGCVDLQLLNYTL